MHRIGNACTAKCLSSHKLQLSSQCMIVLTYVCVVCLYISLSNSSQSLSLKNEVALPEEAEAS